MIAALFVRGDSVYKTLPGVDAWDIKRDARKWPGGCPVVAHPPCRAWGRLRHFAKPRQDEKELAHFAIDALRKNGGVLEHPEHSTLWDAADLPKPGEGVDEFGGWSISIDQLWWGHRARKRTWLYIVGCRPMDMPVMPLSLNYATHIIGGNAEHRARGLLHLPKSEREHTPPALAEWLVELARRCAA